MNEVPSRKPASPRTTGFQRDHPFFETATKLNSPLVFPPFFHIAEVNNLRTRDIKLRPSSFSSIDVVPVPQSVLDSPFSSLCPCSPVRFFGLSLVFDAGRNLTSFWGGLTIARMAAGSCGRPRKRGPGGGWRRASPDGSRKFHSTLSLFSPFSIQHYSTTCTQSDGTHVDASSTGVSLF